MVNNSGERGWKRRQFDGPKVYSLVFYLYYY